MIWKLGKSIDLFSNSSKAEFWDKSSSKLSLSVNSELIVWDCCWDGEEQKGAGAGFDHDIDDEEDIGDDDDDNYDSAASDDSSSSHAKDEERSLGGDDEDEECAIVEESFDLQHRSLNTLP